LLEKGQTTAPKPGKKKRQIDPTTGANTPRTRAAIGREIAATAAREALEAAAKATTAAEAAAIADREVLDVAPLEFQPAPPSPHATARRWENDYFV
jgi:hypothetical protein